MRLSRRRVEHDYVARRVELSYDERNALAPVSFRVPVEGGLELLLLPNYGNVYAVRLPDELAAALQSALDGAARAFVPLVAEDTGDLGPLKGLKWW